MKIISIDKSKRRLHHSKGFINFPESIKYLISISHCPDEDVFVVQSANRQSQNSSVFPKGTTFSLWLCRNNKWTLVVSDDFFISWFLCKDLVFYTKGCLIFYRNVSESIEIKLCRFTASRGTAFFQANMSRTKILICAEWKELPIVFSVKKKTSVSLGSYGLKNVFWIGNNLADNRWKELIVYKDESLSEIAYSFSAPSEIDLNQKYSFVHDFKFPIGGHLVNVGGKMFCMNSRSASDRSANYCIINKVDRQGRQSPYYSIKSTKPVFSYILDSHIIVNHDGEIYANKKRVPLKADEILVGGRGNHLHINL